MIKSKVVRLLGARYCKELFKFMLDSVVNSDVSLLSTEGYDKGSYLIGASVKDPVKLAVLLSMECSYKLNDKDRVVEYMEDEGQPASFYDEHGSFDAIFRLGLAQNELAIDTEWDKSPIIEIMYMINMGLLTGDFPPREVLLGLSRLEESPFDMLAPHFSSFKIAIAQGWIDGE